MNLPTPERWQRIEELLDAALDLPAAERADFVRNTCAEDGELCAQVLGLLEAASTPDARLDSPAVAYAGDLLEHAARPAFPAIDRYRIVREIGRGGMGTVYLAERADFRQHVALKVIRRGLHLDERLVRRFREERQILAGLEHPNIARLLDGGVTDDGLPYFVMEHVVGSPLDAYCDAKQLTIAQRLALFRETCDAVQHAHANGIVHRDLKPSNIHVTEDGRVKLLDFGIAKLLAADAAPGETLTHTGQRPMTPEYASPEQIRGENVGPASDVYSLGVLLYELLSGRRPYRTTDRTPHAVERAVLEEEPERLPQALRGDLDAIVMKALRKEAVQRYTSAGELAEDVRRYLTGEPVRAQPDTWSYRTRKLVRRHRVAAVIATGVAVLLVLSSAATVVWMNRARRGVSSESVMTRSAIAQERFTAGLREYFAGRNDAAQRYFAAAIAEDSTFAMAAYYDAIAASVDQPERLRRLQRALTLANRGPERERLIVHAAAARQASSPALRALADTLVMRFPASVEGHYYQGLARLIAGEYGPAAASFRRVLEMDPDGRYVGFIECAACLSYIELVAVYLHADSFAQAVHAGDEGVRRFPNDPRVWSVRGRALAHAGRYEEALRSFEKSSALSGNERLPGDQGWVLLMAERYEEADALLREQLHRGGQEWRERARGLLVLSLRAQGRLREALELAREARIIGGARAGSPAPNSAPPSAALEAMLLAELGRPAAAAALYDSIARWQTPGQDSAAELSDQLWTLGQRAAVLAAAGDTTELRGIAQQLQRMEAVSLVRHYQVQQHYVRGLLLAARGDDAGAEASLRRAYFDPALGYTRVNVALADLYLRNDRPRDAVLALQPAVRGAVGSWSTYVSRTELHERLGQAWDAAGQRDSAIAHYRRAADAWRNADGVLGERVGRLNARLRTLTKG